MDPEQLLVFSLYSLVADHHECNLNTSPSLDRRVAEVALEGAGGALAEGLAVADEDAVRRILGLWAGCKCQYGLPGLLSS